MFVWPTIFLKNVDFTCFFFSLIAITFLGARILKCRILLISRTNRINGTLVNLWNTSTFCFIQVQQLLILLFLLRSLYWNHKIAQSRLGFFSHYIFCYYIYIQIHTHTEVFALKKIVTLHLDNYYTINNFDFESAAGTNYLNIGRRKMQHINASINDYYFISCL